MSRHWLCGQRHLCRPKGSLALVCLGVSRVFIFALSKSPQPTTHVNTSLKGQGRNSPLHFSFRTSCPCKYSFLDNNKKLTPRRDVPTYPKVRWNSASEATAAPCPQPQDTGSPPRGHPGLLARRLPSVCTSAKAAPASALSGGVGPFLRQNIFLFDVCLAKVVPDRSLLCPGLSLNC